MLAAQQLSTTISEMVQAYVDGYCNYWQAGMKKVSKETYYRGKRVSKETYYRSKIVSKETYYRGKRVSIETYYRVC